MSDRSPGEPGGAEGLWRPRRLVYLGTPAMAVPPLAALLEAGFDVALVVSRPDAKRGRGGRLLPSPVKAAALDRGLAVTDRVDDVFAAGADAGVVVAFGRIIRPHVLDALPMVNLHFSLLPRWRGAAPVERALLAGDERTGVCLMAVEEGLDTGGVYGSVEVAIGSEETAAQLRDELVDVGTGLLVRQLLDGLGPPEPQGGEPTYADKIRPDELELDWAPPGGRAPPPRPGRRCLDHVPGPAAQAVGGRPARRRARSPPGARRAGRPRGRHRRRPARAGRGPAGRAGSPGRRRMAQRRSSGRGRAAGPLTARRPSSSRSLALDALVRIEQEGAYANLALPGMLERSGLDERDRGFATELVYGTTRMRRACDWLVDRFVLPRARRPRPAPLLRLGRVPAGVPGHAAPRRGVGHRGGRPRPGRGASSTPCSGAWPAPATVARRGHAAELPRLDRRAARARPRCRRGPGGAGGAWTSAPVVERRERRLRAGPGLAVGGRRRRRPARRAGARPVRRPRGQGHVPGRAGRRPWWRPT